MPFLDKLKGQAGRVANETEKMLRINRVQGQIHQKQNEVKEQTAALGAKALELYRKGELTAPELGTYATTIASHEKELEELDKQLAEIKAEGTTSSASETGKA